MSPAAIHTDYQSLYEQQISSYQLLLKSFEVQQQTNLQLQNQVTQLQYQLLQLTKLLQGFRTERFSPVSANGQINLGLAFEEAAAATDLTKARKITYIIPQQASKQSKPPSIPI